MSKCKHCIVRHCNALNVLHQEELARISRFKETRLIHKGETIFEEEVGARIEFGQEVKTSAWSKDGNLFAVAGLDADSNKELHIYEFDGSNLIFTYSIENAFDEIYSLDWSYS